MDPSRPVVEPDPDPRDLAFLEQRLAEAAVSAAGVGDEEEFAVLVRDHGRIVAGASAAVWGGGCQIHVVWVDEARRLRGLARALMAEVEAEARRRGCRLLMGLTYDVLTGDFYDRIGFRTVGVDRGLSERYDDPVVPKGPVGTPGSTRRARRAAPRQRTPGRRHSGARARPGGGFGLAGVPIARRSRPPWRRRPRVRAERRVTGRTATGGRLSAPVAGDGPQAHTPSCGAQGPVSDGT